MKGLPLRSLESWMKRASSSLPVPLSASIRTSAPVLAAARARCRVRSSGRRMANDVAVGVDVFSGHAAWRGA